MAWFISAFSDESNSTKKTHKLRCANRLISIKFNTITNEATYTVNENWGVPEAPLFSIFAY